MSTNLQRRTHEIVEPASPGDVASRRFDHAIVWLIGLNVVALVLESIPAVRVHAPFFRAFEIFSVLVFTVEYLLRLWSAPAKGQSRLRLATRPLVVADLLAILPFWLPFLGVDLRVFRVFRLLRIFRMAKLARYSSSLEILGLVFWRRRAELAVTASIGGMLLLLASTLMYFAEGRAQPETFGSIPASMWWAVATLTTVGYGDAVPVTLAGRALAGLIAVLGIGMFALPTGILGAAFTEEIQASREEERCPRCGRGRPVERRRP